MLSAEIVISEFLNDLKKDEKELKKSENREKKITEKFKKSIENLSFLI